MTAERSARAERIAVTAFLASAASAIALAVVYATGGFPELEGVFLAGALGGLGIGLVTVAHGVLDMPPHTEAREPLVAPDAEEAQVEAALGRGQRITRRRVLFGALSASVGALGIAALFPIRSLGPAPGRSLERTPWKRGLRAVNENNRPVALADVPVGGLVTVYPEGHPGSADGQAVVVRVHPDLLPSDRRDSAPHGVLVFSKVCTHAGCPVGLYEASSHQLLCPCHQSAFDVLHGAEPVFGPAARALPELPITIDADGFLVAKGDFPEPIGPGYWSRG